MDHRIDAGNRARRVLLGPWSRWIRDWSDLFRLSFAVAAVVLAVTGNGEAWRLATSFVVALIPRLIATPWPFDLAFNIGMAMQAWGNVTRVFYTWLGYHDIVHFWLTGATAILIYFALLVLRLVPDLAHETHIRQKAGIAAVTFAIGSTINAGYELYEYFDDKLLGGHLLENYHHTMLDLFFGALGSFAAGVALALWAKNRWATRRPAGEDPIARLRDKLELRMRRSAADPDAVGRLRERRRRIEDGESASLNRRSLGLRLLLGDWTRLLRDTNDLARVSMLAGVIITAIDANSDGVIRFAIALLVSLGGRWLNPPRLFEMMFNVALLIGAWGAFTGNLYSHPGYDDATNALLSMATTPILYLLLIRAHVFPNLADEPGIHRRVSMFVAAMCLGFCVGITYQEYVWIANHYLAATIPTSWTDLARRLALDWAGSIAGALALVIWDAYGWGTWRRLDGTKRRSGVRYEGARHGVSPRPSVVPPDS